MKIIQSFSRKMRFLDEALTRLTFKNTASAEASHLFKVAEFYARQSQYNQAYYAYYRFLQNCPADPNADKAKERMAKIHPYAKAVYLEKTSDDFTRTYPKNTMIFSESEPGTELYIIQRGVVGWRPAALATATAAIQFCVARSPRTVLALIGRLSPVREESLRSQRNWSM